MLIKSTMATPQRLWIHTKVPSCAKEGRRRMHRRNRQTSSAKATSNPRLTKEGRMFAESSRKTAGSSSLHDGSFASLDTRLTSSMHAGMGRRTKSELGSASFAAGEPRVPRRSHTSMGFSWNPCAPSEQQAPAHQSGFDIASYVKSRGSTRGITIGVNGRPVDVQMYLENAGAEMGLEEDIDYDCLKTVSEGSLPSPLVPLCWEDQLKKAEPQSIFSPDCSKPKKKCVVIREQPPPLSNEMHSSQVVQSTQPGRLEAIVSKTSVTLSWRESCILGCTPLSKLNSSLTSSSVDTNDTTDASSLHCKKESSSVSSSSLILPQDVGRSPVQRLVDWIGAAIGEMDYAKTPESTFDLLSEFSSADLLGIWFNCCDHKTQKELVKLSFEVFVTATESVDQGLLELSTRAFTKLYPQIVSETVSVIPIHLCNGGEISDFVRSRELKLTVVCDKPRSMLFSTQINLGHELAVSKQASSVLVSNHTRRFPDAGSNPFQHQVVGSLEVPEHFCNRRSSYCDQDDDEDKTDLEGLTRLFPDLRVLEYEDKIAKKSSSNSTKPTSLPIHKDELMRLNSMSVKIRKSPVHACLSGATVDKRSSTFNDSISISQRPLFRPVTRKDIRATHNSNTGYTTIVSSRLMPYLK